MSNITTTTTRANTPTLASTYSTTTAPPSQRTTKLNPGVGIGIALGGALVGALLAGFIAFVLFHRKRRQRSYQHRKPPFKGAGHVGPEKNGMVITEREVQRGTGTNFERLLPLPAEDDAIIGGLSKIRDSIKNHVQNYYHTGPVRHEMVDELRLTELSQATGIPTSALLNFLCNPATRLPTIRLFLGHLILSRLQGRIDGQASFLPNEVSGMAAFQSSASANSCKSGLRCFSALLKLMIQMKRSLFSSANGRPSLESCFSNNMARHLAIVTCGGTILHRSLLRQSLFSIPSSTQTPI